MLTAVILTWKRIESTKFLVDTLGDYKEIDEIILWNNNSEIRYQYESFHHKNKLKIVNSNKNYGTYGRYKAAKLAKNEIVYVQDDDWLPCDISKFLKKFKEQEYKIMSLIPESHINNRQDTMFVGWGCFFIKETIKVLENFLEREEENDLFYRESDLVFTNLNSKDYIKILYKDAKLIIKDDERSLSYQKEHHKKHEQMLKKIRSELNVQQ